MKHSNLGASSMHRWANCPGSVRACEGIESVSTSYALEGTKAHEYAAAIIEGNELSDDAVEHHIAEHTRMYIDYACNLRKTSDVFLIEHKFDLSSIHPGMFGTADLVAYDELEKKLTIVDLKFGAGLPVEVFEDGKPNVQLSYYALGALLSTELKPDTVSLVIVQPRCSHPDGRIRTHTMDVVELLEFAVELKDAAVRTEDPKAPLISGEHCRFCPAAPNCTELRKTALELAKQDFSPTASYSSEALGKTLDMLPVVEAWVKSVREFAYREAEHGRTPPGWKLVLKRANRKWNNEGLAAQYLKNNFELTDDDIYEKSLLSVNKIEKLLSKADKPRLKDISSMESSGTVLAPFTDKRPEFKTDAKQVFLEADFEDLL